MESRIDTVVRRFIEDNVLSLHLSSPGGRSHLESLSFQETSTATYHDFTIFYLYCGTERLATSTMEGSRLSFRDLGIFIPGELTLTLKVALSSTAATGHVVSLVLEEAGCGGAAVSLCSG